MSAHHAAAGRGAATWSLGTEELKRRIELMYTDTPHALPETPELSTA